MATLTGIGEVWRGYRFLLERLITTSLTVQFRKTFLGATWLFLNPLITVFAWVLLHGTGLFDPGATGVPYPAYVLLSTSIWSLFLGLYQLTSNMLVQNAQVLLQHHFPREVYILEKMAVAVFNFLVPFALSVVVLLVYGVSFSWHVVLFPVALIPLILFGSAIGIMFALLKAVFNDLNNLFDKLILLVMYITPVVYTSQPSSPLLQDILRWNPLTYLLGFPRDLLTLGHFTSPVSFLAVSGGTLILFLLSLRYFRYAQPRVMERLIA